MAERKGWVLKLVGSKTELDIREELINSKKSLFKGKSNNKLFDVLQVNFPKLKTAYTISWIPEQGEDLYKILIDDSIIVDIEINRVNREAIPIVKTISISEYSKGLSKISKIRLAVAMDLAQKDLKDPT